MKRLRIIFWTLSAGSVLMFLLKMSWETDSKQRYAGTLLKYFAAENRALANILKKAVENPHGETQPAVKKLAAAINSAG